MTMSKKDKALVSLRDFFYNNKDNIGVKEKVKDMSKETEEQLRIELDALKTAKVNESKNALEKLVREQNSSNKIQEVIIELKECYEVNDCLKQFPCDALVTVYFENGEYKVKAYKQFKGKWFY